MDKVESTSLDLEKENINKIKELFPNVVTENKIDFEKLRLILGDEIDDKIEKYQFTWNGKSKAIKLAQSPSTATLRPSKEDSVNWDTTENLYIEGDNLGVLKQLQKTYFGKIKMIYIDPPYNTGANILYKNDFSINEDEIKKMQGDNYKKGGNYFKNKISSASFHTDWINIMYSRLLLAKNLMSDDGVISIAIDHNELANLIKICDEIFGEINKLGIVTVVHKPEGRNQEKYFATSNEYALFYSKNKDKFKFEAAILDESIIKEYNFEDDKGKYKGNPLMRIKDGSHFQEINLKRFSYPIYVNSRNLEVSLEQKEGYIEILPISSSGRKFRWRMVKETFEQKLKDNAIFAVFSKNKQIEILEKYRITNGQLIKTHWTNKKYNATVYGTKILSNLMDGKVFDFPKSLYLLIDILKLTSNKNSIILDFFSGSATTAHAVMKLNAEDGGNRKFIMVQLPEKTDEKSEAYKAGYKNICEIGKERIRRAGKQIVDEMEKESKDSSKLDIGFKVFKLDETNIKEWNSSKEVTEKTLFDHLELIKNERTKEDVLYEILLKYGVFDKKVKEISINNKKMFNISNGYMIVNLNDDITDKDLKEIINLKPHVVIFMESAFKDDNAKINAEYTLKHNGVEDIKCI